MRQAGWCCCWYCFVAIERRGKCVEWFAWTNDCGSRFRISAKRSRGPFSRWPETWRTFECVAGEWRRFACCKATETGCVGSCEACNSRSESKWWYQFRNKRDAWTIDDCSEYNHVSWQYELESTCAIVWIISNAAYCHNYTFIYHLFVEFAAWKKKQIVKFVCSITLSMSSSLRTSRLQGKTLLLLNHICITHLDRLDVFDVFPAMQHQWRPRWVKMNWQGTTIETSLTHIIIDLIF